MASTLVYGCTVESTKNLLLKGKAISKTCYNEELVDMYSHVAYVSQFLNNNIETLKPNGQLFLASWSLLFSKLEKTRIIV